MSFPSLLQFCYNEISLYRICMLKTNFQMVMRRDWSQLNLLIPFCYFSSIQVIVKKLSDQFILLYGSASTFGAVLDMVTDRYSLNKIWNLDIMVNTFCGLNYLNILHYISLGLARLVCWPFSHSVTGDEGKTYCIDFSWILMPVQILIANICTDLV